ncbi:glycosyltransferase family 9 protein [Paraburkholderia sp. SUR17]|uniref:glycosyltransferase family 9 protein n=1 Tax=Paraburkholderia sp. SUR17 TaxID=3034358 RepID=UPI0024086723|nr:glycosyltransferase family 9 protein [Paraburkholderia sp. SUR17]WEY41209.1 glycosyltransferase family 9 protein [Paraburkholderia sp. SUR17]
MNRPTGCAMAALFSEAAPPETILVICTARIGDVVLTTPVVRALKTKWPGAQIDMLIFEGTGGALENNPDIRRVIAVRRSANLDACLGVVHKLWRRYDLACSLKTSSVAMLCCWMAGRKRVGVVAASGRSWTRRRLLHRFAVEHDASIHVVESGAAVAELLGISPSFEVVPPAMSGAPEQRAHLDSLLAPAAGKPYVVLQTFPKYQYKRWHVEGWASLIRFVRSHGYAPVLTGGADAEEVSYANEVASHAGVEVIDLVGKLSFGATAEVIRHASLFVGPDTSTTHVAAATGVPTIALFGPSNPMRWGPWPKGWTGSTPWTFVGSAQRGNVWLIQGNGGCVPCEQEGCERNLASRSDCLSTLGAHRVIDAAAALLRIAQDVRIKIPVFAERVVA